MSLQVVPASNELLKLCKSLFIKCLWRFHAKIDARVARFSGPLRALREERRFAGQVPDRNIRFFIVSCGRNSGKSVIKCLQSVYDQEFERRRVVHWLVDDASDDSTVQLIDQWREQRPDHSVRFVPNEARKGGTANTYEAFQQAPENSVILELNADDWLPDDGLFEFLSRVYSNPDVWMTYNSFLYADGTVSERRRPYPARIVRMGAYRDYPWICQHLHTFRSALVKYLPRETFLNPETGEYLSSADDRSIYWSLLELCRERAIHLERITYIYNLHPCTDFTLDRSSSERNARLIRRMPRLSRLRRL